MKNILIILLLVIVPLIFLVSLFRKEPFTPNESCIPYRAFTQEDANIMKNKVNKYPITFSVDPFYTSTFKPECCPNEYSTSSGCLCMNPDIYSLVVSRGGNSYS
jgi:hypothetical protein